jgi:hypothetical protein
MMMLSRDYWLSGASRRCETELGLVSINSNNNPDNQLSEEDYSLLKGRNPEGIREMAEKLQRNEREFTQVINDKSYKVVAADIPEVNYFIVGLEKQ